MVIVYLAINQTNIIMAEIKQGILGGVTGKVGTVIGYTYRDKNIIRSLPSKSTKPASEAQLLQRSKLTIVVKFLKDIKHFINAHYPVLKVENKVKSGYDQIRSDIMLNGLIIEQENAHIIPERVLLSIGILTPAVIQKVSFLKDLKVKVRWDNTLVNSLTNDSDLLTMIAFNDELNTFYVAENIANRIDRFTHFELPLTWLSGTIHFWSVWKSADKPMHSTSTYHTVLTLDRTSPSEETVKAGSANL